MKCNNPKAASDLIKYLIDNRNDQGEWPIDFMFHYSIETLRACFSPKMAKSDLMFILKDMKRNSEKPVDSLIKKYTELYYAAKKNIKKHLIILPIYLANVIFKKISINGNKYHFSKWPKNFNTIMPQSRISEIQQLIGFETKINPGIMLCRKLDIISPDHGYFEVKKDLELLRGIVAFTLGQFGFTWYFSKSKASNVLGHHHWFYCHDSAGDLNNITGTVWAIDTNNIECVTANPNNVQISYIKKLARILSEKIEDKFFRKIISDSLILYAKAQDEKDIDMRFLSFWQIAEQITSVENVGGDTDKVVDRLIKILTGIESKIKHIRVFLLEIASVRNKIVHSGESEIISDDQLFVFKRIIDVTLLTVINYNKKFTSESEWDLFLRHANQSQAELKEKSKILKEILKAKNPKELKK